MQYLRRSISLFYALQQLKGELATIATHEYQHIFSRLTHNDPNMNNLMTRVVRVRPLITPFVQYGNSIIRMMLDVDNVLMKHPVYPWANSKSLLLGALEIQGTTDRFVREKWPHEMREGEVHFMFSLVSIARHYEKSLMGKDALSDITLSYVEDEAFLILKEYGEDFGHDTIYVFYQLAFTDIPKPKKKTTKGS